MGACDCIITKVCFIFSLETIYLIQFQACWTNSAFGFLGWTRYNCRSIDPRASDNPERLYSWTGKLKRRLSFSYLLVSCHTSDIIIPN